MQIVHSGGRDIEAAYALRPQRAVPATISLWHVPTRNIQHNSAPGPWTKHKAAVLPPVFRVGTFVSDPEVED